MFYNHRWRSLSASVMWLSLELCNAGFNTDAWTITAPPVKNCLYTIKEFNPSSPRERGCSTSVRAAANPYKRANNRFSREHQRPTHALEIRMPRPTCASQDAWAAVTSKWPKANFIHTATCHAWTRTPCPNIAQEAVFFSNHVPFWFWETETSLGVVGRTYLNLTGEM